MNRMDSGLGIDCDVETVDKNSSTLPAQHGHPVSSLSLRDPQSTGGKESCRPAPKRTRRHRDSSSAPRRKSTTTSSSEASNKSRGRGNGSKPSSRRTSCTLVDPSRPARHYRIKSTQTTSSINRDVDDVLALHFRSCSLFQNVQNQSALANTTVSERQLSDGEVSPTHIYPVAGHVPHASGTDDALPEAGSQQEPKDKVATTTTIHWTSPATRRREYETMDKAHSGIRGAIRKVIPNFCLPGPPPPKFYDENQSDTGSVRRYRMDIPEDEEEMNDVDEKNAPGVHTQSSCPVATHIKQGASTHTRPRRRWGCF
jgi:hypothetical protein